MNLTSLLRRKQRTDWSVHHAPARVHYNEKYWSEPEPVVIAEVGDAVPVAAGGLGLQSQHFAKLTQSGEITSAVNYATLDKIVKQIPPLDVAMRVVTRLAGGFGVKCDDDQTQDAFDEFLGQRYGPRTVLVCGIQRGFSSFHARHCRPMLQYGRSLGEIVLDGSGKEIGGLWEVNSSKVRVKYEDGELIIGEQQGFGEVVWFKRQDLFLYNLNAPEGDDPHGKPMIRSVPWVANILVTIENAIRSTWQRTGSPSFLLMCRLDQPKEGRPLSRKEAQSIESAIRSQWKQNMRDRWEQEGIRDFSLCTTGDFSIRAIGADLKQLEFKAPYEALTEQIMSTTELAPFMLGMHRTTTERMSDQQCKVVTARIEDIRDELEPDYMRVVNLYAQLHGLKGRIRAHWRPVTLQDMVEKAKAAQAVADDLGAVILFTKILHLTVNWSCLFLDF